MKALSETLTIHTEQDRQFIDITKRVRDALARTGIQNGMVVVNSLHTTLALFVNEFQPALLHDLETVLEKCAPYRGGYRHDDPAYSDCDRRNGHAHLRAILLGRSVALPVAGGEPVLGQDDALELAELDGPRERVISLQAIGD